jgi:hypothetical protein
MASLPENVNPSEEDQHSGDKETAGVCLLLGDQ